MMKILFCVLFGVLLHSASSLAAENACWATCANGKNSTQTCRNTCGVPDTDTSMVCMNYCNRRGGSPETCASLCALPDDDSGAIEPQNCDILIEAARFDCLNPQTPDDLQSCEQAQSNLSSSGCN